MSIENYFKIMGMFEFIMSVWVIVFYYGKEIFDFFEKKRLNLILNCFILKFRFVIKIKVYIWYFLFDKIRYIGKDEFLLILLYCNFKCW